MLLRCEALGKDKKKYCESNLNNIVVATGGTNQLGCIDCITNQHGVRHVLQQARGPRLSSMHVLLAEQAAEETDGQGDAQPLQARRIR